MDSLALKSLKDDESIIITRPDKGRGSVVLDKLDYNQKVDTILQDASKFQKILADPFTLITRAEDKLTRCLRSLLNSKTISKDTFQNLSPSGSSPGILYGLPKVHKVGAPIRPILSAIGTFNYNLAKFLVPILDPITKNDFTV